MSSPQTDEQRVPAEQVPVPFVEEQDWLDRAVAYVKPRPWVWGSVLVVVALVVGLIVHNTDGTQPLGTDPTVAGHPLSNPDQHLHSMAVDPVQPGLIYLGSHYGVFTSTDDGKAWPQSRGALNTLMITSLSVSRQGRGTLGVVGIAAIGNDVGVFLTHDGGTNWRRASIPTGVAANAQPYLVRAGATASQWFTLHTGSGLFVSNDDGHTWHLLRAPVSLQEDLHALWQSTLNPLVLLLGGNVGLYLSLDGGQSWQTVGGITGGVHAIAASPASPATVFVAADSGVYRSVDGGVTYALASGLVAQAPFSTLALSGQRASVLYGLAGNEVWRSGDGGTTWTQQKILQTASPSALLVAPDNDQHLYAGFYAPPDAVASLDGGLTWRVIAS